MKQQSSIAGFASLRTAHRYTAVDTEKLLAIYDKAHPRAGRGWRQAPGAKGPLYLLDKFQAAFDPVEPLFNPVDTDRLPRVIAVDMSDLRMQRRHLALQRSNVPFEIADIIQKAVDLLIRPTKVDQHDILGVVAHDAFLE